MRSRCLVSLQILVGALLLSAPLVAEATMRPTIGIAFSGGGARGFAHIGVMRVLEELHVPVDYAAGTSMGAIIGGLYASGMSPDQLEETVSTIDWPDALSDRPGRRDLVFRRKDDDLHYIPGLELGLGRGGIRFPTGLRSGQKLNYLLRRVTMPVRTVVNFDDLPVPFRAVATEIATGEMVVLDHGDLARAMRASMAIPTVFSPVEIGDRLLVDGGVTDNLPVDVVRSMGADVVIAIDIGVQLAEEEEAGRSFLSILGQTSRMMTRGNMIGRLAQADLVITPDMSGVGAADFGRAREIVARGEAEARRLMDRLRPYALSEEDYAAWKSSRRREPDPVPTVTMVDVEGAERVDRRVLDAQIRLRPGTPFSAEAVRSDLSRLYGLGDFETVDVELRPTSQGTAVVYQVREKPWGPTYLRMGVGIQSDDRGRNDLAVLASLNRTRLDARGAEWRTRFQLGSFRYLETELYQPLDFRGGWFVSPAAYHRRYEVPFFLAGERIAELDVPIEGARLDLGYNFGRYGEMRLGLDRSVARVHRGTGTLPPELERFAGTSFDRAGLELQAVLDRLDSATLPKDGSYARLNAFHSSTALGADEPYDRVELHVSEFKSRNRHTFFGNLDGGVSPGTVLPIHDQFRLGGFFSLSAFEPGELRGDNYGVARAGYYYRLGKVLHLGGFVEAGNVAAIARDLTRDPIFTQTVLIAADTPLGPFYVALASADRGQQTLYLFFGRPF